MKKGQMNADRAKSTFVRLFVTGLAFFAAVAARGEGVGPVDVSGTGADAFRLSWKACDGATGYVVNVWTNGTVGASEGVVVLGERFSGVPNQDYKNSWSINDINASGDYRRWTGEFIRGYPSTKASDGSEHAVVLGTADAAGWLLSDPLEVSGEALVRLRLTRHTDDDTAPALVAFVKDDLTNFVCDVSFGTAIHTFSDYSILASNLSAGCRLLVSSQRKQNGEKFGRVAVAGISVRGGYSAGTEAQVPVVKDAVVGETAYLFAGARPVRYGFSVAAKGDTADRTPAAGEVDMGNPPWLRCWRTSSFLPKPGMRVLDLAGMGKVKSRRDWLNGEDGDGLYAYSDAGSDADLRPYSESATHFAVYQFDAGTEGCPTNALALLGNGSSGLRLVLPIRLDARKPLAKLSVAYAVRCLNWRDSTTKDTALKFAWKACDDFRAMENAGAGWRMEDKGGYLASSNGAPRVERRIDFPVRKLRDAKYLFLQWSVPKQANSAMIGLSDLAVSGALRETGTVVFIR